MKKAADLSVKPRANNKYNNKILYFISFIEGGAVIKSADFGMVKRVS